ncbi:MAG: hypothetical protein PF572_00755 [Patescibacteria group bacterium]|jgi:hypothetical protein|nr:hypothetical protein [Patescibacteria group bacterium]
MKRFYIFILISFLFSCNQTNKTDSIIIFETILGEKETTALNEIVTDFDTFLDLKYPNKTSIFETYINDLTKKSYNNIWRIDSTIISKYADCNIFPKYDLIFPDSVWYDGLSFKIKYSDNDVVEEITPIIRNGGINIDSMILEIKTNPKFLTKHQSSFLPALDSIKDSDSLIFNYLDAKSIIGNISTEVLSKGLMIGLSENNEYFAKRILIMDGLIIK